MSFWHRLGSAGVRWRYPLLAAWAVPWFVIPYRRSLEGGLNDWLYFEFGARVLVHFDGHYAVGAQHLYAEHPEVQIGPPPLALVAAFQWLPPKPVALAFAVVMALAGLVALALAETAGRAIGAPAGRLGATALAAGVVLLPVWCASVARFRHLDDVIVVLAVLVAAALIAGQSRRAWWVAALLVGLAVASKPWALAAAPLLLGLPRARRAPAALLALATAGAAWLPFVLGDAGTASALSSYRLYIDPRSPLTLLGFVPDDLAPNWVRPVQLVVGFTLAVMVASRGRWLAVPLAACAARLAVDPQVWPYYSMAPVAFAVLLDLTSGRRSSWPWWTLATVGPLCLVPLVADGMTGPARLAWSLVVLVLLLRPARRPRVSETESAEPVSSGSSATIVSR